MCDVGLDGDSCTIWSEDVRRAAKPHQCDGCGAVIAKGEAHIAHRSMYDGVWSANRMCFGCWATREQFRDAHPRTLIPAPENIRDTLEECIWDGDADSELVWRPLLDAMDARGKAAATHA